MDRRTPATTLQGRVSARPANPPRNRCTVVWCGNKLASAFSGATHTSVAQTCTETARTEVGRCTEGRQTCDWSDAYRTTGQIVPSPQRDHHLTHSEPASTQKRVPQCRTAQRSRRHLQRPDHPCHVYYCGHKQMLAQTNTKPTHAASTRQGNWVPRASRQPLDRTWHLPKQPQQQLEQ